MPVFCNLKLFGCNTAVNASISRRTFYSIKSKIKEAIIKSKTKKLYHPYLLPPPPPVGTHLSVTKWFSNFCLWGSSLAVKGLHRKEAAYDLSLERLARHKHPLEQQHKPHHMLSTTNMFTCTQLAVLWGFIPQISSQYKIHVSQVCEVRN